MSKVVLDIIVVLVIICIGGFFSASEMALVSLREGQIRALAKRGKRGQKAAKLAQDPNRFFSAVQIGVTLATLVAGGYGATTLAGLLKSWLIRQNMSAAWAGPVSFIVVTICITFFSLILGELAPKRIGLQRAPRLALLAAPLLDRIATLARPVVWLLTATTNLVVAVLGGDPRVGRQAMTEQEVRELVTSTRRSARTSGRSSARSSTRANGRSARSWCRAPRWSSWTRRPRSPRPPPSPRACRIRGCRSTRRPTTT